MTNVIEEYNRKEFDWKGVGDVTRDGRTRNAKRILAEKHEEKKQSGRQIQRRS